MSLTAYLVVTTFLDTGPVALLMFFLFRNRMRFSRGITALLLACMCGSVIVGTLYTFQPSFAEGWVRMTYSMLALLLSFAVYLVALRRTACQVLFTLMLVKSYRDCISLLVDVFRKYFRSSDFSRNNLFFYSFSTILALLVTLPFILLFLEKCVRPIAEAEGSLPYWRYLWAIPTSFYFLFRLGVSPYYLDPGNSIKGTFFLPYIWAVAVFLTYFFILRMLSVTIRNAHLEERLHISDLQTSMQRELYDSLRSSMEDTRRLRHDIRHHLAALKGYTENDDCAGAGRYLDSLLDDFKLDESLCENYAVDAVARHYITAAKALGVAVDAALHLPQHLSVEESDVCVVMGNLLENAVEACDRQREGAKFISAKAAIVGRNMVAITVRNSYSGEVRRDGDAFLSAKQNSEAIGISSVRAVADQYRGTAKFTYEDGVFTASVLLNP